MSVACPSCQSLKRWLQKIAMLEYCKNSETRFMIKNLKHFFILIAENISYQEYVSNILHAAQVVQKHSFLHLALKAKLGIDLRSNNKKSSSSPSITIPSIELHKVKLTFTFCVANLKLLALARKRITYFLCRFTRFFEFLYYQVNIFNLFSYNHSKAIFQFYFLQLKCKYQEPMYSTSTSTSTTIRYFWWKIYFQIFQLIIVFRMEMTVNLICLEIVLYFSHRLTWQTQE